MDIPYVADAVQTGVGHTLGCRSGYDAWENDGRIRRSRPYALII
ncbi:hypothetical protein [Peribacillus butanolivorans]